MKSKLTKEEAKQIIVNYFNSERKCILDVYKNNIRHEEYEEEILNNRIQNVDNIEKLSLKLTDDIISECVKKAKFKNSSYIADMLLKEYESHYFIPNNVVAAKMASIYMSADDIHLKAFMEDTEHEYTWRCSVIDNELYWMKINA